MISRMYFSSAGSSSCRVALTIATSRSVSVLVLATLASPMVVRSLTAPKACLSLLGAIERWKSRVSSIPKLKGKNGGTAIKGHFLGGEGMSDVLCTEDSPRMVV